MDCQFLDCAISNFMEKNKKLMSSYREKLLTDRKTHNGNFIVPSVYGTSEYGF